MQMHKVKKKANPALYLINAEKMEKNIYVE